MLLLRCFPLPSPCLSLTIQSTQGEHLWTVTCGMPAKSESNKSCSCSRRFFSASWPWISHCEGKRQRSPEGLDRDVLSVSLHDPVWTPGPPSRASFAATLYTPYEWRARPFSGQRLGRRCCEHEWGAAMFLLDINTNSCSMLQCIAI